jgi:PAS domain S-box-containing protein
MDTRVNLESVAESDQLREAIAAGQVDAFLVGKEEKDKRVLLLAGAYTRYRQLVEQMQQGAVTCSVHGDILYANQRFAQLMGVPLAQLYAAPLDGYVAVPDRARLSSFLLISARMSSIDIAFTRRDGMLLPTRVSLVNFADGYATLLVTALSERQWASIAEETLNSMRSAVEVLNRSGIESPECKRAADLLSREINGLSRLLDELTRPA